MIPRPLLFRAADTPAERGGPDAARVLSGNPQSATRNHYTDRTGQFFSGEWSAEPGAWQVRYAEHEEEFCLLLAGEVRLTDPDGQRHTLQAGDAFVIPGGYQGIWENVTPVSKLYAIMALKEPT
jgi:uncharacterized cupin superfamily protein